MRALLQSILFFNEYQLKLPRQHRHPIKREIQIRLSVTDGASIKRYLEYS